MRWRASPGKRITGQVVLAVLLLWFAASQIAFGFRANHAYTAPLSELQGAVVGQVVDTATLPVLGKDTVRLRLPDDQIRVKVIPLRDGGVETGHVRTIRFDFDAPTTARYEAAVTRGQPGWKFIATGSIAGLAAILLLGLVYRSEDLWDGAGITDWELLRVKFSGHHRHGGA